MNLIACYLAGNCEKLINLSLKSIYQHVDKIIIVYDTTSRDDTIISLTQWKSKLGDKLEIIPREYEHSYEVKSANSDARNFYLDYLKKNHLDDWCLVLDADEVAGDNIKYLKSFLEDQKEDTIISPKMIHFIQDLGHEDSTQEEHYVPNRLFKVNEDLFYPTGEHPVLISKDTKKLYFRLPQLIIYHLAYCREMFYIRERYSNHLNKSEMHTSDFLWNWYHSHLRGQYPKKELDINTLPQVMKDFFFLNRR